MEKSNRSKFEMDLLDLNQKQYCCPMFILWLLLVFVLQVGVGHDGKMVQINFIAVLLFMHKLKRSVFFLLDNNNQTLPNNDI